MRDDAVSVRYVITLDDVVDINRLLTRGLNPRLTTVIATLCGIGAVAAVVVGSAPTAVALGGGDRTREPAPRGGS